jgi:hypothetical protein
MQCRRSHKQARVATAVPIAIVAGAGRVETAVAVVVQEEDVVAAVVPEDMVAMEAMADRDIKESRAGSADSRFRLG